MTRLELAPEVLADFDRFFDHLAAFGADNIPGRIAELVQGLQVLTHSPLIGRKLKGGMRELVVGQGGRGYVALYRFLPAIDTAFVLAVRHQREAGYAHR